MGAGLLIASGKVDAVAACASMLSAGGFWAIGSAFEPRLPARGTAGSGAAELAPGGRPASGIQSPQLLLRVATGGRDQRAADCPLPSRRNQLLINAQLPSDQAEACSAGVIELRDDLERLLQRNWTKHPK